MLTKILSASHPENTAPRIAYCIQTAEKDPKALMIAAPADNLIPEADEFALTRTKALDFVDHINALVTIGVKPTYPKRAAAIYNTRPSEAARCVLK